MQIKAGTFCPLVNGECKKLECVWFTQIAGSHPQTGEEFDEWGCAVAWMPLLTIENIKKTNEAENLFKKIGITFSVYNNFDCAERLIPFDMFP